jgi:hypothetical protein
MMGLGGQVQVVCWGARTRETLAGLEASGCACERCEGLLNPSLSLGGRDSGVQTSEGPSLTATYPRSPT